MQEKLCELKEAASERNWNECVKVTTELLEQLGDKNCALLASDYIQEYLPTFEQQHPNTRWPREKLSEVLKKMEDDKTNISTNFIIPDVDWEFDTPGSNGFVKELEALWELVLSSSRQQESSDKAASIIAGIIMARLANSWGLRHPDEWLQWYRSAVQVQRDGNIIPLAQTQFMGDRIVAELQVAEWQRVADRIQNLLAS